MDKQRTLLLAGGDTDPQMVRLLKRAAWHGIPVQSLLVGQAGLPCLHWDINANSLQVDGTTVTADAAFIRQDVFTYLKSNNTQDHANAREWYLTVAGWLLANPTVRTFNRHLLAGGATNKPYVLHLALQVGLPVTQTYVSNSPVGLNALAAQQAWVNKPVGGGAHCTELPAYDSSHTALSHPQIVQQRLVQPELRVFRIGTEWFGFWVRSDALDYRTSQATRLEQAEVPPVLASQLEGLADLLGLEFAAADFKTDAASGELQFLEINSNPMFAGFDQIAGGALTDAILRHLGVL